MTLTKMVVLTIGLVMLAWFIAPYMLQVSSIADVIGTLGK